MSSLTTSSEQSQSLVQDVQNETTALLPKQTNIDIVTSHISLNEGPKLPYDLDEAFYILVKAFPILLAAFLQYAFSVASVFTLGHIVSLAINDLY